MVPDINNVKPVSGAKMQPTLDDASKRKLQKAVTDFEAMFVNYLLQNMNTTSFKPDDEDSGFGGDTLQSMFNMEVASSLSRNSSFGIGDLLYKQMTGESLPRFLPSSSSRGSSLPRISAESGSSASGGSGLRSKLAQYQDAIADASSTYGLDPALIKAVIAAESGGDPRAMSPKNAKGLMQLIDSTAGDMGVWNVWNPRENILGGSKYLKTLLDQFNGDTKLALASYNAGPEVVKRHGGVPPFRETQDYVNRVMNFFGLFQQGTDEHTEH